MLSQEEIAEQQKLLATYRRTLAIYLQQRASIGELFASPGLQHGILEARHNISRIKDVLLVAGITVVDDPDDEESLVDSDVRPSSVTGLPELRTVFMPTVQQYKQAQVSRDRPRLHWKVLALGIGALVLASGVFVASLKFPFNDQRDTTASPPSVATAVGISLATPAALSTYKPLFESNAIITARDGTTTTVFANTLSSCISNNPFVNLDNGYSLAFDTIKRIDVVRAEPAGGKAVLSVTLLNGSVIAGGENTCTFIGQTTTGRFELATDEISSIDIVRQ